MRLSAPSATAWLGAAALSGFMYGGNWADLLAVAASWLALWKEKTGQKWMLGAILVGMLVKRYASIFQPAHENAPNLALTDEQTSLAFDLIAIPNHRGHIIGPGRYKLDIFVAAENAPRIARTIELSLGGSWHADEARMLRDGVGVTVL